jgi:hypothetical protein
MPYICPKCNREMQPDMSQVGLFTCEDCSTTNEDMDETTENEQLDQLVGKLLEELDPEPEPQLRPFDKEDWMTYGGADRPEGSEPLIGEITLGSTEGDIIVDRNGVGIHALGYFYYHPTPFAQGRGIAAQLIRARPDVEKLGEFGFERVA